MTNNIEEYLEKIREYLYEYNRLANELFVHYKDQEYLNRLNLLEEHVMILKQGLDANNLNEKQKQQKFLEHHFATIQLANQHMQHIRHQLECSFVNARLEFLKREMQRILEELERKRQELSVESKATFSPAPRPGGSRQKDDDKTGC